MQLRQLVQKIQQIYAEGPVVSGWLASEASLNATVKYSHVSEAPQTGPKAQTPLKDMDVALFRHGDADDLMNYLSALESAMLEGGALADSVAADAGQSEIAQSGNNQSDNNASQYYLCRLQNRYPC